MAYEEFHKFIDEAVKRQKLLGEARMMIGRAHRIIDEINSTQKAVPVWLQNALIRLREALTYDEQ